GEKAGYYFVRVIDEMVTQRPRRRREVEIVPEHHAGVDDIRDLHGVAVVAEENAQRKARLVGELLGLDEAPGQRNLAEIDDRLERAALAERARRGLTQR